jgi:hypothetical protein
MSDPAEELQATVLQALRTDPRMAEAFAPQAVRVFDTAPTNARGDYIIVGGDLVLAIPGTDAAEIEVTLDVWSLTDPPGKAKAKRIGAAATAVVLEIADLPSHLVKSALPSEAQYLTDRGDGLTAHGILKLEIVTQPKPLG